MISSLYPALKQRVTASRNTPAFTNDSGRLDRQQATLCSVCTGVMAFAFAGLLNGMEYTTTESMCNACRTNSRPLQCSPPVRAEWQWVSELVLVQ